MRDIFLVFLSFILFNTANAGFHAFTMHSRANCVNNESISWEYRVYRELGTVTHHYHDGIFIHGYSTGWENTWRSAAAHWGEALPGSGWRVVGYHWQKINGQDVLLQITDVSDCSIYDGWWDK